MPTLTSVSNIVNPNLLKPPNQRSVKRVISAQS